MHHDASQQYQWRSCRSSRVPGILKGMSYAVTSGTDRRLSVDDRLNGVVTLISGYPSHLLFLETQFWHAGLFMSHLMWRFLISQGQYIIQPRSSPTTCLHVKHPALDFEALFRGFLMGNSPIVAADVRHEFGDHPFSTSLIPVYQCSENPPPDCPKIQSLYDYKNTSACSGPMF
jgi:hypothetical protein